MAFLTGQESGKVVFVLPKYPVQRFILLNYLLSFMIQKGKMRLLTLAMA